MSTRAEKPFISLGSPRGIALSSLDKYIEQSKQEKRTSIIAPDFQAADQSDTISNLQREQSRLCEELNAERRRSESLKSTYSRALSLSTSQMKNKLDAIKRILQSSPKKTAAINRALKYIESLESNDPNSQDTPNPSELEQQVKEAELSSEKETRLNKALKKKIQQMSEQREDLNKQIEEAQKSLDDILADKKSRKDKLKAFIAEFKKREAQWKEKYQALEAELEAQH
ncbi:hypothetical protein TRFO_14097 [Tritrichomonas foetus]|uniref:Uncharacterized protein n=1 Tax=Tritrichomonas foetus TaxID=1144522 RepID=A0A1J4KW60_9EUKA|nr:hypothetical protein TRFO_14097 [Tritrichomonas foetus]|eukprot:OHT15471.1 hypothetical protein TRFO_14097 [Tritrichomonas foetus]